MSEDKRLRAIAEAAIGMAKLKMAPSELVGIVKVLGAIEQPKPYLVQARPAQPRERIAQAQPKQVSRARPVSAKPAPKPEAPRRAMPKVTPNTVASVEATRKVDTTLESRTIRHRPPAETVEPAARPMAAPSAPAAQPAQLMKKKDVGKPGTTTVSADIRTSGLTPEEARAQAERLFR